MFGGHAGRRAYQSNRMLSPTQIVCSVRVLGFEQMLEGRNAQSQSFRDAVPVVGSASLSDAQALTVSILLFAACGISERALAANAQAFGSANFHLSRPAVYVRADGVVVTGVVCRRNQTTLLSPEYVRIESIGSAGEILDVSRVYSPTISVKADQPCERYSTHVIWGISKTKNIRVCLNRNQACLSSR